MDDLVTLKAFEPDWAVSPGETIGAILSARSLSRECFAEGLGESVELVQRLLLGLETINDDLADRISHCLGSSHAFWIAREKQFRTDSNRISQRDAIDEREIWIKNFPVKEMVSLGWINDFRSPAEAADNCLKFFGVPDVASWQSRYAGSNAAAAFRISASARKCPEAVTAWLRWAELIAGRTPCAHWNPEIFREQLRAVRRLTWQKHPAAFLPSIRRLCAEAGVAIVVARTPKGCPASGATRFLSKKKAMIVLSFRYRTDDQFWFTFFHEAGHLLLHSPDALFIEDESETASNEEQEANEFAETILIPQEFKTELHELWPDKDPILRFARRVGVAPGLVVGQLQHCGRISVSQLNWLKRRYDWDHIEADRLIP